MIKRKSLDTEFNKNALTLMIGTAAAQVIPFAVTPILTRIYTPKDFGVFALYMSIASILSAIATGRYEMAIMLPRKEGNAINLVAVSIIISFLVSFISIFVLIFFNSQIENILGYSGIYVWLLIIPFLILSCGVHQSLSFWSNRNKKYKRLAINRVVQSGAASTLHLGLGVGGMGSAGLIIGQVIGQFGAMILLSRLVWREDMKKLQFLKRNKMISLALKYIKLPKYNLPNAIIDALRLSGINILIAKYFTSATLGQFSLAWKIVQMPTNVIGGSLSQVFFQKLSCARKNDLFDILSSFVLKASLLSAPIYYMIYLFGESVFKVVFGDEWVLAGSVASTLAPWLFLNFISLSIANVFIVINRQEVVLMVSIIYMLVPIAILIIFNDMKFISALNLISMSMSFILTMYILLAFIFTKKMKDESN